MRRRRRRAPSASVGSAGNAARWRGRARPRSLVSWGVVAPKGGLAAGWGGLWGGFGAVGRSWVLGEPLVPRGAPLFVIPAASFSPGEGVGLGHGVVAGVVPALGDLPGRRGCGGGFGVPQTSQERLEMSVKSWDLFFWDLQPLQDDFSDLSDLPCSAGYKKFIHSFCQGVHHTPVTGKQLVAFLQEDTCKTGTFPLLALVLVSLWGLCVALLLKQQGQAACWVLGVSTGPRPWDLGADIYLCRHWSRVAVYFGLSVSQNRREALPCSRAIWVREHGAFRPCSPGRGVQLLAGRISLLLHSACRLKKANIVTVNSKKCKQPL